MQKASALEKLAAAHHSVFALHSHGIWVASIMPTAVRTFEIIRYVILIELVVDDIGARNKTKGHIDQWSRTRLERGEHH
jgi:hypothetical protein